MSEESVAVLRIWLKRFAENVAVRLKRRSLATVVPFTRFPVRVAPYTNGWCVDVADLRFPAGDVAAAFLDDISGGNSRRLWVGVFASGVPRIRQMARTAARHVGAYTTLGARDFRAHRGKTYMRRPLRLDRLDRPILEVFEDGLKDFGVYLPPPRSFKARPDRALVEKAARFLEQTLTALDGFRFRSSSRATDRPFANRSVVVTTNVFARSAAQAVRAKARDRYTCRLCGGKPEERYGAEGRACLEAHHVRALHSTSRRNRRTTLKDLVTVCANCHRVLGKLSQDERTFAKLRRRFRQPGVRQAG